MTDIRVGIVTENYFPLLGGMEFSSFLITSALDEQPDIRAFVACSAMPLVPQNFSYPHHVYRARSFPYLIQHFYNANVRRMIEKEKADILHGMMLHGAGVSAVKMGKVKRLPIVVHSWGADVQSVPEIGYGAPLDKRLKERVRFSVKNADRVIAVSNMNRDMILEFGAKEEKIDVVPAGCSLHEIAGIPYQDLRPDYNLQETDFVLITVGRNSPVKRMDLLFQALSLLKDKAPHIKCWCVGPTKNLGELADKYHLQGTVILTGSIPRNGSFGAMPPFPELINLYRSSDLFVSVSYVESFNLSALDALACGLPVLVTKNQGIRDVILEGETGFVLNQEAPDALAETILALSGQKELLGVRREEITNSVAHLTYDNVAKRLREIYLSLLG
jgi:glycosyltransferase involved in cell wall biosynthesis